MCLPEMEDHSIDQSFDNELVSQTSKCKNYLESLRTEHLDILKSLQEKKTGKPESRRKESQDLVNERISSVIASLQKVEAGVEETEVIISLQDHFQRMENERNRTKMEMKRIKVNTFLRIQKSVKVLGRE